MNPVVIKTIKEEESVVVVKYKLMATRQSADEFGGKLLQEKRIHRYILMGVQAL